MSKIEIRKATPKDAGLILKFVKELAAYEKAKDAVTATESDIQDSLFGKDTTAHALLCSTDNEPIGFAVYFFNYSTWQGRRGLYLEDLFIIPSHRGSGAGKAILKYLAGLAVAKNCGRFEWSVLDWNTPAIRFYESIGAIPKSEWVGYQLAGQALDDFAGS